MKGLRLVAALCVLLSGVVLAAPASAQQPLTASFDSIPDSHDGSSSFEVRIRFSEELKNARLGGKVVRVTNGDNTGSARVDGAGEVWEITIQPDGNDDVTIKLVAGENDTCGSGLACTTDFRPLSATLEDTVEGPTANPTDGDSEDDSDTDTPTAPTTTTTTAPSAPTSVPARPTGLAVAATHEAVTLSWDDPDDDSIERYLIHRRRPDHPFNKNFVVIGRARADALTYADTEVAPGYDVVYRVQAENSIGKSTWSSWARITVPDPPPAAESDDGDDEGGTPRLDKDILVDGVEPRSGESSVRQQNAQAELLPAKSVSNFAYFEASPSAIRVDSSDRFVAQCFRTGREDVLLRSVTLRPVVGISARAKVSIREADGIVPSDTDLHVLEDIDNPEEQERLTLGITGDRAVLNANTDYCVVVSRSARILDLESIESDRQVDEPGWSIKDSALVSERGSTWSQHGLSLTLLMSVNYSKRYARTDSFYDPGDFDSPHSTSDASIQRSTYFTAEGRSVTVRVKLQYPPSEDLTIPIGVGTAGISAPASPEDYTIPTSVTVPAGSRRTTFQIKATEDGVDDPGEMFDFRLRREATSGKITARGRLSARVTIVTRSELQRRPVNSNTTEVGDFTFFVGRATIAGGSPINRHIHDHADNVRGFGIHFNARNYSDGTPRGRPAVEEFGILQVGSDPARIHTHEYRDRITTRDGGEIRFEMRGRDFYEIIYSDTDVYDGSGWGPRAKQHNDGPVFAINMNRAFEHRQQGSGSDSLARSWRATAGLRQYMYLRVTFPDHPGEEHWFDLDAGSGACMTGYQPPRFTGDDVEQTWPYPTAPNFAGKVGPWHTVMKPGGWDNNRGAINHYEGVICWANPGFAPGRWDFDDKVRIRVYSDYPEVG